MPGIWPLVLFGCLTRPSVRIAASTSMPSTSLRVWLPLAAIRTAGGGCWKIWSRLALRSVPLFVWQKAHPRQRQKAKFNICGLSPISKSCPLMGSCCAMTVFPSPRRWGGQGATPHASRRYPKDRFRICTERHLQHICIRRALGRCAACQCPGAPYCSRLG